jgi:uncharacterized protein
MRQYTAVYQMEVRDPVHGFIRLTDSERAVVDHSAFQRLRRIRQLAMTDLVYPGAVHHRFEHSIGVMHVADRMARHLGLEPEVLQHVRLAALVHDIGHGPFSHVSEDPLAVVNTDWLRESGLPKDKLHEQIGLDIVRNLLLPENVINRTQCDAVCEILDTTKRANRSVPADIVSGPLDADKMDYLLRDSRMAGVQYGVFDLERLILGLVTIEDGKDRYIGVHESDVPALDQYLIARYNMHAQVYGHKTRIATDLMLGRAILAAIEDKDEAVKQAYSYSPGDSTFLSRYLDFDDRRLLDQLVRSKSERARRLTARLLQRRLVRRILDVPLASLADSDLAAALADEEQRNPRLDELHKAAIGAGLGLDPDCLFVRVEGSQPVRKGSPRSGPDPNLIKVKTDYTTEAKSLSDVSAFFRDYKHTPSYRLVVYGNVDPTAGEKHQAWKNRLTEAIEELVSTSKEKPHAIN